MNEIRTLTVDDKLDAGGIQPVDGTIADIDINLDITEFYEDGGTLGATGVEPTTAQVEDLLEALDLRLCAGTMSSATKQVIIDACQDELDTRNIDTEAEKQDMVQAVITSVLQSPRLCGDSLRLTANIIAAPAPLLEQFTKSKRM